MDKRLIAERFAKARGTYDREARVQQQVAERMMRLVLQHTGGDAFRFRNVVEFGCGTGSYSSILLHTLKPETLLLNDLCPEMEECVENLPSAGGSPQAGPSAGGTVVRFRAGDAEELDFPTGTDLLTSCSTLQWFTDPAAFFARSHRFLKPGGILAFTTFGPSNMHEIRSLTGHGLDYLPLDEVRRLVALHFDVRYAAEEVVSLPFADPTAVLRHLKLTGVTGTEKRTWTRRRLQAFCEDYTRRFAQADGNVTLTYHPIYIIAQNKTL